jgi:hypothetical protein
MERASSLDRLHQKIECATELKKRKERNYTDGVPLRINNKIAKISHSQQPENIAILFYGTRNEENTLKRMQSLKSQGFTAHKLKTIKRLFDDQGIFNHSDANGIFWSQNDSILQNIDIQKLNHIQQNMIYPRTPYVRDFYRETPMEALGELNIDQMKQIDACLCSHSEYARDFVKNNGIKRLKEIEADEINQLRQGLESHSEFARNFFQDNLNDIMVELTLEQQKLLQSMLETPSKQIEDFVIQNSLEQIGELPLEIIEQVTLCLSSSSKPAKRFLQRIPIKKLADIDDGIIKEIRLGLESPSIQTVKFFEKIDISDINKYNIEDMHLREVRTVLDDDHKDVRHYFRNLSIENVSNANSSCSFKLIRDGLLHKNKTVSDYFKYTTLEDFRYTIDEDIETILNVLSGNNADVISFFKNSTIDGNANMADDDNGIVNFVNEYIEALNGNDPKEILTQINQKRDDAQKEYFSDKPDNISDEQMEKNIDDLYESKIYEVIEYSKKAVNELQMSPEIVYSQRFDRNAYRETVARKDYFSQKSDDISMAKLEKNIEGLHPSDIEQIVYYSKKAINQLNLSPQIVYGRPFDRTAFKRERYLKYSMAMLDFIQSKRPAEEYQKFQGLSHEAKCNIALRIDPEYILPNEDSSPQHITYPQNLINITQTARAAYQIFHKMNDNIHGTIARQKNSDCCLV